MTRIQDAAQAALADRIRPLLPADRTVEKRMFGTHAFMVDGALLVCARKDGALLVRTDPAAEGELTADPHVARAEMSGRTMGRGWLAVEGAGLVDEPELARWVRLALRGGAAAAS